MHSPSNSHPHSVRHTSLPIPWCLQNCTKGTASQFLQRKLSHAHNCLDRLSRRGLVQALLQRSSDHRKGCW